MTTSKLQQRLAQYLILPDVQTSMPPTIKSANTLEQLVWATGKAVRELSAFVVLNSH